MLRRKGVRLNSSEYPSGPITVSRGISKSLTSSRRRRGGSRSDLEAVIEWEVF